MKIVPRSIVETGVDAQSLAIREPHVDHPVRHGILLIQNFLHNFNCNWDYDNQQPTTTDDFSLQYH